MATLTKKDFQSDVDSRWCPGCGDYAVLNMLTAVWAELGIKKENLVVISGIGCSSRLPYYTDAYGFHTIHGRAPTVALGSKLANPDLDVWVVTGDGDSLSIGGNHFMHLMRRNPNVKVLLFNNEIYGLTKGQASPTSQSGLKTKSTPFGSIDQPVKPLSLALTSGASFVGRIVDAYGPHMKKVLLAAGRHKGVSVVEILTNCIIFNDKVFNDFEKRDLRQDSTVELADGQPMLYGKNKDKGVILDGLKLKTVDLNEHPEMKDKVLVHKTNAEGFGMPELLAASSYPEVPLPIGIFKQVDRPVYEESVRQQEAMVVEQKGKGDLNKILMSGETWQV